jgi:uncharacterized protein YktA (UPF0223 family)
MQVYNALQVKAGAKTEYNKMGTLNQPIQFLPRSKKDEDWAAWCLDWLEWQGLKMVRRNARRLMKNYKLAKGLIDRTDYVIEEDNEYADLIDTLTKEDTSALELKFYPIIPNVINTLTAEFSKRVTRVTYGAVDEYSYNEMLEQKKAEVEQLLVSDAKRKITERMIMMGADPQSQEFQEQLSPEALKSLPEIEAFYQKDYRSMIEQWAEHQHRVDTERFYMDELEERGFRDLLIADREFWHFKMMEDDYDVELWNPVLTFYQKAPETRYISDGNWVGKYDMMTVADVIDKYGWLMTDKQMESIELIYPVRSAGYPIQGYQNDGTYYDGTKSHAWNTNMPSLGYRQFTSMWDSAVYGGDIVNWIMMENEDYLDMGMSNLLRVTTVYWKSQRRVGHLTKITLSGDIITEIVDEDYVVTDKPEYNTSLIKNKTKHTLVFGEHIDWIWINQVWGGVKIGPNRPTFWGTNNPGGITPIYLGVNQNHIGPLKFQFKGDNSLYGCKLPVEGSVFSDRNTYSRSLVDLMKPFQIAYNIVNNQIADILVDELGTVIMLDQNSLPRHSLGEDWGKGNFAKAYVAMKNFQMLPLDTSITNTENALNFNHFQKLDMSQTERLMSRIQLAQYFKQQAFEVIGITPQRLGQEISRQTATGIEQSINASYAQTESYFIQHCDYLMPRVHQMRTDLSQHYQSTKPSARLNYITSLDERKNFEINGTDFLLRDINVFATTKANQRAILEQLKQLALNNNTAGASIYDLGNILKSDSISEVTHILKQTEKKADQVRQQDMQQQQQMQEQMIQAKQQEEQLKREFESSEKDKDRQADIIVAQIRSAGYGAMMDINENKQSDYMDAMDQIQKSENYQSTMDLNREKEANKMMQSREKLNIEREKINAQREIANTQLRIAQENKNRFDAPNKTEEKNKKKKK